MSSEITRTITTRTPIVTGDWNKKNDELLITGLRGSLRYQYWLLKAIEAWTANQTNPSYPHYDLEKPIEHKNAKQLADDLSLAGPVVQLFGTTGWRHLLHLSIPEAKRGEGESASARPAAGKQPHHWSFTLVCRPEREIGDDLATGLRLNWEAEVKRLLAFVHHHGWLGAAPQNGFGWVTVSGPRLSSANIPSDNPVFASRDITLAKTEFNKLKKELISYYKTKGTNSRYSESLKHIKSNPSPIGYEIRRFLKDRHFGSADCWGSNYQASLIHVSHPVANGNGGCLLRLRCVNRPGNSGLAKSNLEPANYLDQVEKAIKNPGTTGSISTAGKTSNPGHRSQYGQPAGKSLTYNPFDVLDAKPEQQGKKP